MRKLINSVFLFMWWKEALGHSGKNRKKLLWQVISLFSWVFLLRCLSLGLRVCLSGLYSESTQCCFLFWFCFCRRCSNGRGSGKPSRPPNMTTNLLALLRLKFDDCSLRSPSLSRDIKYLISLCCKIFILEFLFFNFLSNHPQTITFFSRDDVNVRVLDELACGL